ncbi:hypothetical protein [Brevibacterium iodinum]|uniref:hypothetical protein n=1 Tax=Brevibacterium iodinum TaxID=31943 RepID=UPI0011AF3011|nr:hypothetical protein [Brevibacterium iodinum]
MTVETAETVGVIVQTLAVLVAASGVIVALSMGVADRRAADARADLDRREARRLADHHFRLDMLVRLARNVNDPGHTDDKVSSQLAAERAALLHVIGPDGLPITWETYVGPTVDESRSIANNADVDKLKRCQNEVAVKITDEIANWRSGPSVS